VTAALSTMNSMSAKLNNCLTKVVQWETVSEDDQQVFIQDLLNNLEELNKEKEIVMKYIQQQSEKETAEDLQKSDLMYPINKFHILHVTYQSNSK
jgi:hypothetical protein